MMNKNRNEKKKTISRMKALLGWDTVAKCEKGGQYIARKVSQVSLLRNMLMLKTIRDDDQMTNDSSKIRLIRFLTTLMLKTLSISLTNKNNRHVNSEIHSNLDGNSSIVTLRSRGMKTTKSDCRIP
ncbi:hypothetical protein Hdeb2414_s0020g00565201 [Helianthus debilis subsp. tardiflorus]